MTPLALLLSLSACDRKDVQDDPLPTSPTLPLVGTDALQFRGRIPKNLIFLSIDTFRKDHLSVHGSKGLTPFLEQIAREGVVLDDHHQCANWTFGSTTCTIAGRYSVERGHMPRLNGTDDNRPPVPQGTPFLATWLGDVGYYSVLVSANDWLSAKWGNAQGYSAFKKPGGNAYAVHDVGTATIREEIQQGGADKWFMHLHFMEPHASYDPPSDNVYGEDALAPWPTDLRNRETHYDARDDWPAMSDSEQTLLEQHLRVLYEGEIRTMDERLEDIWEDLEKEGYLDDTLVVIWNDHGEQFWEHGHQTHAYSMYGEENDGFAIFWSRNIVGARYTEPTASIDLVPTVLDLFGVPIPQEVTGWPLGTAPDSRPIFGETIARRGAINTITRDGYKMIFTWYGDVEVYDRNTDPTEQIDLFDPQDPWQLELWSGLRPFAEAMQPLIVGGSPAPSWPETLP